MSLHHEMLPNSKRIMLKENHQSQWNYILKGYILFDSVIWVLKRKTVEVKERLVAKG